MSLSSEIEEFRAMINRMVESLEEVSATSRTIPETQAAELSRKFSMLADGCEEVSSELRTAIEMLEAIRAKWGR
jgi:methyl-accepting chemotaxis protein